MTLPTALNVTATMESVTAIFTAFPIISTVVGFVVLASLAFGLARRVKGLR